MSGRLRAFAVGLAALHVLAASVVLAQPKSPEIAQAEGAERTGAEPEADDPSVDAALGERKLRLEIRKLEAELGWLSRFVVPVVGPLAIALVGAWWGFMLNRRLTNIQAAETQRLANIQAAETRRLKAAELAAERFNAFFDKRAEAYSKAFEILKPTALFFHAPRNPVEGDGETTTPREQNARQLTRNDCRIMGRQLSEWYFGAGGLLMTKGARDAYFALAEALRLAAGAADDNTDLAAPSVAEHPSKISARLMSEYREKLANSGWPFAAVEGGDLNKWSFGAGDDSTGDLALRYKDFILIQTLASRLRTALTEDLGSREPPNASSTNLA